MEILVLFSAQTIAKLESEYFTLKASPTQKGSKDGCSNVSEYLLSLPSLITEAIEGLNYSFGEFHYLLTNELPFEEVASRVCSIISVFLKSRP